MKMCLSLVHVTTLVFVLALAASAQADLPQGQIVTLNLDPQNVTVLHLRRGYVSSVRLPEEVSSVVLGGPRRIQGGTFRDGATAGFLQTNDTEASGNECADYHQGRP